MRRVLVVLSITIGLAFGATSIPPTSTQAGSPIQSAKTVGTITIDKIDDPFDAPATTIVLPTKSPKRGALVIFSVAPLVNAPKELIKYTYVWVISPDPGGVFLPGDGTQGAFGSGSIYDPKQYKLTLVSNFVFVSADNKLTMKSTKTETTVDIDDGLIPPKPGPLPPGPGPGPVVPVPPEPPAPPAPVVIPDGRFKLGQYIYDSTKAMPGTECKLLADELRRLAGRIAQGAATPGAGIRTKSQLVRESVAGFPNVLGASLDKWRSVLDGMAIKMDSLKLPSLMDCQDAYNELATGLEARK